MTAACGPVDETAIKLSENSTLRASTWVTDRASAGQQSLPVPPRDSQPGWLNCLSTPSIPGAAMSRPTVCRSSLRKVRSYRSRLVIAIVRSAAEVLTQHRQRDPQLQPVPCAVG